MMHGAFHNPLCEVRPSSVLRIELLPRKTVPVRKVLFLQSFRRLELALQSNKALISHGFVQSLPAELARDVCEAQRPEDDVRAVDAERRQRIPRALGMHLYPSTR